MNCDIRDFGAVGDGIAFDTDAIQCAIDKCSAEGGGVVNASGGTYLIGTIFMKDNVELRLESTAILLGTPDLSKYYKSDPTPYRKISPSLIYASGVSNFAITGSGIINFQGEFFSDGVDDMRPAGVRFRDCADVKMERVLYKNAASFTIHPIHCERMLINGIRIYSMVQPNNDGIDLDGCKDVFISNCNIESTDDNIALKAIEPGKPCSDIVITNCILRSLCAAIRIGPDAVEDIVRVTVSNCVIRDTNLNGIKIQESFGAKMQDFTFSNIVMDNVAGPISVRLAGWKLGDTNEWAVFGDEKWPEGKLRNILFDNIRATAMPCSPKLGISITGTTQTRPQNLTFSNIDITFPGGGTFDEGERRDVPDMDRAYPECGIFGVLPAYGLYVHHADGITFNNTRFTYEDEEHRPAIVIDDASDIELSGFKAQGSKDSSLIRFENVRDSRIINSRVIGESSAFLQIEGSDSKNIVLTKYCLGNVKSRSILTNKAPSDSLSID